jgi:hypothetical protein
MAYTILKLFISAAIIAGASELARKSTAFSALLISLPLISILSYVWVYLETKDAARVAELSTSTLLLVVPSLAFFVILTFAINQNLNFWLSLGVSIVGTFICYLGYWKALTYFGVKV